MSDCSSTDPGRPAGQLIPNLQDNASQREVMQALRQLTKHVNLGTSPGAGVYGQRSAWYINPTSGLDTQSGASNLPLQSLSETARRIGRAVYQGTDAASPAVTIHVLGDLATTDIPVFLAQVYGLGYGIKISGINGMTVVRSSTLTGVQSIAGTGARETREYWIEDSSLASSWTAAGAMAAGLIFKRTNGTECWWYPAEDLGSKRLKISCPLTSGISSTEVAISSGDAYTIYRLPQIHDILGLAGTRCYFELVAPGHADTAANATWCSLDWPETQAIFDRCSFRTKSALRGTASAYNCRFVDHLGGGAPVALSRWDGTWSGGIIMDGTAQHSYGSIDLSATAPMMMQGGKFVALNDSDINGLMLRMYDGSGDYALDVGLNSRVLMTYLSGSGNTHTKLARIRGGRNLVSYVNLPPRTTDGDSANFGTSDTWYVGGNDYDQDVLSTNRNLYDHTAQCGITYQAG